MAAFLLCWGKVKKGKRRTDQIAKGIQAKKTFYEKNQIQTQHIVLVDCFRKACERKLKLSQVLEQERVVIV